MEPTKSKAIVIKPNNWQTQLTKNTTGTLREIAKLSPIKFEVKQVERKKLTESLDTLQRSRAYFKTEYKGDDALFHLQNIDTQIEVVNHQIALIPESKTIGQLERLNSSELEDSLILILNDLRLFFQVDSMISTDGLYMLVDLILSEYRGLTLEEIAICMAKAKKGEYGQLFNRLDGGIIMGWLKKYNDDRLERQKERNYAEHSFSKFGINDVRDLKPDSKELTQKAHAAIAIERAIKGIKK